MTLPSDDNNDDNNNDVDDDNDVSLRKTRIAKNRGFFKKTYNVPLYNRLRLI